MKKLVLSDYRVEINGTDGTKTIPYHVRSAVVELLFNPELKLGAVELLKRDDLGKKILKEKDFILLEKPEYDQIKSACEFAKGFSKNDVELVRRILEAEEVDVEVKK